MAIIKKTVVSEHEETVDVLCDICTKSTKFVFGDSVHTYNYATIDMQSFGYGSKFDSCCRPCFRMQFQVCDDCFEKHIYPLLNNFTTE